MIAEGIQCARSCTRHVTFTTHLMTLRKTLLNSSHLLQAVIHCEIVRQAARVVAMDRERLRSGDRAHVRFRFLQRPEYLTPGTPSQRSSNNWMPFLFLRQFLVGCLPVGACRESEGASVA